MQDKQNVDDDLFIRELIEEAKKGLKEGGIPIGSILVRNNKIIGRGHNRRIQDDDPIAHAEIACLKNAGRIGSYEQTVLYSTLMPCYLCAGAIVQFGIKKIIVGESKNFQGAVEFLKSHGVIIMDLESEECISLMENFIKNNPELWNEDIGKK
ncbi:MAG: nucleoside deaminase [Candidatus Nitrosotenuis sp.]|nr:MAG: nucleoside deaminase [Candidatus Nitrosotenuis sp.]